MEACAIFHWWWIFIFFFDSIYLLLLTDSEPVDDSRCAATCLNSTGVFAISFSVHQSLHARKITKSKELFQINSDSHCITEMYFQQTFLFWILFSICANMVAYICSVASFCGYWTRLVLPETHNDWHKSKKETPTNHHRRATWQMIAVVSDLHATLLAITVLTLLASQLQFKSKVTNFRC